jgi:hypothetical protein
VGAGHERRRGDPVDRRGEPHVERRGRLREPDLPEGRGAVLGDVPEGDPGGGPGEGQGGIQAPGDARVLPDDAVVPDGRSRLRPGERGVDPGVVALRGAGAPTSRRR